MGLKKTFLWEAMGMGASTQTVGIDLAGSEVPTGTSKHFPRAELIAETFRHAEPWSPLDIIAEGENKAGKGPKLCPHSVKLSCCFFITSLR